MSLSNVIPLHVEPRSFGAADVVAALRAAGEETRLRILLLLRRGELTVSDLTEILSQSQPRISRHIKILIDAGLVHKHREGNWTSLRLADANPLAQTVLAALEHVSNGDPQRVLDRQRLEALKSMRERAAQAYFDHNAAAWREVRQLHVDEARVEEAMLELIGAGPFERLIDLGTGTGRILELLADRVRAGMGIDMNAQMLGYARARLEGLGHRHLQVRKGNLFQMPQTAGSADLITMHQVLHFLDQPGRAIEAARMMLRPGGRMVIVDFAPHSLEALRKVHKHLRLGLSSAEVERWLEDAGLALCEMRNLSPTDPKDKDRLTVSLWLARLPIDADGFGDGDIDGDSDGDAARGA